MGCGGSTVDTGTQFVTLQQTTQQQHVVKQNRQYTSPTKRDTTDQQSSKRCVTPDDSNKEIHISSTGNKDEHTVPVVTTGDKNQQENNGVNASTPYNEDPPSYYTVTHPSDEQKQIDNMDFV